MREIDKVLDEKEKVLWEGVPQTKPYVLRGLSITLVGVFLLGFSALFFWISGLMKNTGAFSAGFFLLMPMVFLIAGILLLLGPLWSYLSLRNTYYAITDKRVIIQKGIIGRDFEYVDFDQITNAEVNVGFLDKTAGNDSGTISVFTAGSVFRGRKGGIISKPYTLCNIGNPYKVFRLFKDVSHSVKTDIEFPNKFRPKTNPGYNSKFKTK
ncbi:MAG: PH domain-containing protein [Candidatus Aenigmatarchaeota archaeon]